MPMAEQKAWASSSGNTMTSPAVSRMGGADPSIISAQHDPSSRVWNENTYCECGITLLAIPDARGVSTTQGSWNVLSKKIAPVRRTTLSTSDSTSMALPLDEGMTIIMPGHAAAQATNRQGPDCAPHGGIRHPR